MDTDALPELTFAASLRRTGQSTRPIERRASAGSQVRVRSGAYADGDAWRTSRPSTKHLLLVVAAQHAARGRIVFSHESAAALWGIPIVGAWPALPQATTPPSSGRRSTGAVRWHRAALGDEVSEVDGFLVTSPLRTVLDLIATRTMTSGVVIADHVLHHPLRYAVDRSDLLDAIDRRRPFRGARQASVTADFSDRLSESPNESVSRVQLARGGFPAPVLQRRFIGIDGKEYFTDFYFPGPDAIGESDGWMKYEDPLFLKGRTAAEAFRDEKRREDALRPLVSIFVRWDWDDAWRGSPLFAKLRAAGIHPSPQ